MNDAIDNYHMTLTSIKELRRTIAALLSETPLAGIESPIFDPENPKLTRRLRGETDDELNARTAMQKNATSKFFNSKKFNDNAVKLYANLSVPIYIVPMWSGEMRSLRNRNVNVHPHELLAAGLSEERLAELTAAVAEGAAVFVVAQSRLLKGALPTPWMIIHALFDDENDGVVTKYLGDTIEKMKFNVADVVYKTIKDPPDAMAPYRKESASEFDAPYEAFISGLTMASAKGRNIQTTNDVVAEIMTQAVLTKAGFKYNETGDEMIDAAYEEIAKIVAGARAEFEEAITGKMIKLDLFQRG